MKVSTFYLIGAICFVVVASTGIYTLITDFKLITIASRIGMIANNFFYLVLAYFFYNEYKKSNYQVDTFPDNSQEVLKELETLR